VEIRCGVDELSPILRHNNVIQQDVTPLCFSRMTNPCSSSAIFPFSPHIPKYFQYPTIGSIRSQAVADPIFLVGADLLPHAKCLREGVRSSMRSILNSSRRYGHYRTRFYITAQLQWDRGRRIKRSASCWRVWDNCPEYVWNCITIVKTQRQENLETPNHSADKWAIPRR
jgi:hypothetical protein